MPSPLQPWVKIFPCFTQLHHVDTRCSFNDMTLPHRHEALGVNWPRGPTIPHCYRRHQAINTFYSPTAATTINLFFSAQAVMMVTILLGHTFFSPTAANTIALFCEHFLELVISFRQYGIFFFINKNN